jgi:hypothetical protein
MHKALISAGYQISETQATLQYLSVPGKLRERMLALDSPRSLLAEVLEELFVEAVL